MEKGDEKHNTEPNTKVVSVWQDAEDDGKNILTSINGYLFLLSAFGLFYHRNTERKELPDRVSTTENKSWRNICQLCICIFVILLLLFNFVRYAVSIVTGDSETKSFQILFALWTVLCFMNGMVSLSWSYKTDGIEAIFKQWTQNQHAALRNVGLHINTTRRKKIAKVFIVLSLTVVLINVIAVGVLIFADIGHNGKMFASLLTAPFSPTVTSKICCLFLNCLITAAWLFPMMFFVLLCHFLKEEIVLYNNNLKCSIYRKSGKIQHDLLRLRVGHLELCKTVDTVDRCFRLTMLIWMSTHIAIGCFSAYILSKTHLDAYGICLFLFWLFSDLCGLGVVSIYSAMVHDEMHSSLCYLFEIDTTDMTLDQTTQLNLFLTKLTGSSIGITVMGLVTITKELLLTIAGLYLTYFLILLQF